MILQIRLQKKPKLQSARPVNIFVCHVAQIELFFTSRWKCLYSIRLWGTAQLLPEKSPAGTTHSSGRC